MHSLLVQLLGRFLIPGDPLAPFPVVGETDTLFLTVTPNRQVDLIEIVYSTMAILRAKLTITNFTNRK